MQKIRIPVTIGFMSAPDRDLPSAGLLKLVSQLIEERKKPWSLDMVRDPVQERLADIINEKKKGAPKRAKVKAASEPAPSNVINIMDALRRSVAADAKSKKPPPRPKQ